MADGIPAPALCLHDPAPAFTARSTQGPISLSSYRGKWVLLFSHPADFTSVCTSEFLAFARAEQEFARLDCALLGLSVDSLYAHLAWLKDIEEKFGIKIGFPLIEDSSMVIARAYGMLDANAGGSGTVRGSFVIDPVGVIRAIVWYPMNVGRSVAELLRLVEALQTAEREQALTPEGWKPGEALMEPAATRFDQAGPLKTGETWYYRERQK
ncbi:peroxiredoxin [Rhizobium helianthi]|uniref:Thioredoxin peroxidase n=1 Tax=Rhizobium helianthi TaxID=1132695 RepID=A0ABW4M1C3_9HYPH